MKLRAIVSIILFVSIGICFFLGACAIQMHNNELISGSTALFVVLLNGGVVTVNFGILYLIQKLEDEDSVEDLKRRVARLEKKSNRRN